MVTRPEELGGSADGLAVQWVGEAERLIAAGNERKALKKLDDAAWNVSRHTPHYEAVFERIRKAAQTAARGDGGRLAGKAEKVVALANSRERDVVRSATIAQQRADQGPDPGQPNISASPSGPGAAFNKEVVVAATPQSLVQALVAACSVAKGCHVTSLGPGSIVVTRKYRPGWVIAVAIIGALFFLVGLLVLLYQAEETLTITLSAAEGGTRVVTTGVTSGELIHRVNGVLSSVDEAGRAAPAETPAAEAAPTEDTKRCPDCAEVIKAAARKCRFCGYRFAEDDA